MDFNSSRQKQLLSALHARRLDGLLVTSLANIFYLTGFHGTAGAALFGPEAATLWVDPRYTAQARSETRGVDVVEARTGLLKAAGRWIKRAGLRSIGYEDSALGCRQYSQLKEAAGGKVRWTPAGNLVEPLRAVKDAGEIELIRGACRLTAEVFREVLPEVRAGATEMDLAAELEYRMKRKGADGAAFETIVASGRRASLPHARPSAKLLEEGDLVIFDLGAILHGYAADMTRTVSIGHASRRARRLYQAVREAQQEGLEAVRAGARAGDVDAATRRALRRRGLDKYFVHSTGHGVGIEIHEAPRLGRGERTRIEAGAVVTIEPGVYLDRFGGIRIEDTVLVGAGGAEILTPASKDDWIFG